MATNEELAASIEAATPPGISRITVRPITRGRLMEEGGVSYDDARHLIPEGSVGKPWGAPDAQGRPSGRLFEPDLSPAPLGAVVRPDMPHGSDPNFRNRYMVTIQEPGQPDREQFTLPAARAARARYGERYGIGGLVRGDYN